jgi:hypothetical protein
MENSIYLETQGIKGGNTKTQKVGYVFIQPSENLAISVDAFEGAGHNYKPRKEKLIIISTETENIFEGTIDELILKLK